MRQAHMCWAPERRRARGTQAVEATISNWLATTRSSSPTRSCTRTPSSSWRDWFGTDRSVGTGARDGKCRGNCASSGAAERTPSSNSPLSSHSKTCRASLTVLSVCPTRILPDPAHEHRRRQEPVPLEDDVVVMKDTDPLGATRREHPPQAVRTIDLAIGGMTCPHCPPKVEQALRR